MAAMKYPESQFSLLVNGLKDLSKVMDLNSMHPCALHFLVYQQGSEGQTHNYLYLKDNTVKRAGNIENLEGWQKVANVPATFELYPEGCNDNHIETAVKRAIKAL